MRTAVYTAITNHYDTLRAPRMTVPGWDYLAFTDGTVTVPSGWQQVDMTYEHPDPKLRAKFYKVNPHLVRELDDYDITVYIDGHLEIKGDLRDLVETVWSAANFGAVGRNNCTVYDEAETVIRLGKADAGSVNAQMQRYRDEGYPGGNGFFQGGLLIRQHKADDVIAFAREWWREIEPNNWHRDQLSHMVAVWRTGLQWVQLGTFSLTRNNNPYVIWRKHTKGCGHDLL